MNDSNILKQHADVVNSFFTALWPWQEEGFISVCTDGGGGSGLLTEFFPHPIKEDVLLNALERWINDNVWFSIGLFGEEPQSGRGTVSDVVGLPGLVADIDCKGGIHNEKNLPTKEGARQLITELPFKPSIIIWSGGGFQVYWLFNEPWIFNDVGDREKASDISLRWQRYLVSLGKENGWKLDSVGSLEHLFRIPGMFNCKADPVPVEIVEMNDFRYSVESLQEFLEDVPGAESELGGVDCLSFSIKHLIQNGAEKGSRSEATGSVLCSMLKAGVPEDEIIRCFESEKIGEKYREKGNGRVKWLRDEIGRARVFLANTGEGEVKSGIRRLNKKHAVIMVGGRCCVLNQTVDPVFNRQDISFSSKTDFLNLYANQKIGNPAAPLKQISIGKLWWESPARKQYDGLVFAPEKKFPGYYNLWRGFAVEPKKGDWSLMKRLICEAIASGYEERYWYILAWLARIVQHPGGQRPGVAFVMRGRQGVGKGVFATNFGTLLGQHFIQVAQSSQVVGRFNNHLKDCVLLFVDEGFWAGDRQAEGVIKNLVTEPTLSIEPKGKDLFKVKNNVNILIASNSDWVVPAGLEERRFFTVDVAECFKGNYEFFRMLAAQMEAGGREAMLYDLQAMDISGIDLRDFERTDALLDQILESMTLIQKWWFAQLRRGAIRLFSYGDEFGPQSDEWPHVASNEQLYESFEVFVKNLKGYLPVVEVFGRQLNKLITPVEMVKLSFEENGPRKRGRVIPSLEHCRKVFEKRLSIDVDWDDEKLEIAPF